VHICDRNWKGLLISVSNPLGLLYVIKFNPSSLSAVILINWFYIISSKSIYPI